MSRRKPVDSGHDNLGVDMDPHGDVDGVKSYSNSMPPSPRLNINRIAYSVRDFNEEFETVEPIKKTLQSKVSRHFIGAFTCSPGDFIRSVFPIIDWVKNYKVKQWLLADLISGFTVAIFQAPQSMGYSLIAHVPPVHGLYTSFFPCIMYTLFGTSRHSSIGAFAIVSGVMTGNIIVKVMLDAGQSLEQIEKTAMGETVTEAAITTVSSITTSSITTIQPGFNDDRIKIEPAEIAAAISFVMGVIMPLGSLLRLGFISIYLSDQFLSGFTTAAALYIFTSQLRYLTGVHLPYESGYFAIVKTVLDLIEKWTQIKIPCVLISFVCICILLFSKIYINKWLFKKGIQIPFPIELLVVIGATLVSTVFDFHGNYGVPVVGHIQAGLPAPKLPRWEVVQMIALKSIPLALVGFTIALSIGKIYGRKHGYNVVPNQELFAIGVSNFFGSLFSCLPVAASLPRSVTQEASGGKTQLVSIINSFLIFFVLVYLSPLLDKLPNCVLASIIAVALRGLLAQSRQFHMYWKISKLDGAVWMITFLSVIILDIDLGLYFSLASSLLILIYKSSRPKTYLLGPINETDVYVPVKKYVAANCIEGIKIYQFCGPLHFASLEFFKSDMLKKIGIDLNELINLRKNKFPEGSQEGRRRSRKDIRSLDSQIELMTNPKWASVIRECRIVIVDCSMLSYIDANGVTGLKITAQEFGQVGIRFFLAGCAPHVIQMLSKDHFFQEVGQNNVFISVHDAVLVANNFIGAYSEPKIQNSPIVIEPFSSRDKHKTNS